MARAGHPAALDELVPAGAGGRTRALAAELDLLARWKYDSYEGYGAGRRFWDHALGWLRALDPEERLPALELLRRQLVFVSRAELAHLVERAYPDRLRPALLRRLAAERGLAGPPFGALERSGLLAERCGRTLVVGLSDGARLDLLRRATPELASRQFVLDHRAEPPAPVAGAFAHVVAVDDFSGTGGTLIRREGDRVVGRVPALVERLSAADPATVAPGATGSVLVYVASRRAAEHLRRTVPEELAGWDVIVLQELADPTEADPADAATALRILRRHYGVEPAAGDKGGTNMGYRGGELPLVMHHNAPNDAMALVWASPAGSGGSALFPRYERLQAGRD